VRLPREAGSGQNAWEPENETFWESEGKQRAWSTLRITTASLMMAFSVWFLVSVLSCVHAAVFKA